MSGRSPSWPATLARHAILISTAALMLLPFVWMLSLSIKAPGEMFRSDFALLPTVRRRSWAGV